MHLPIATGMVSLVDISQLESCEFGASVFSFTLDSLMWCCIHGRLNNPPRCMYLKL